MAALNYYDVIQKPLVTEKSMTAMAEKKYTFLVHLEGVISRNGCENDAAACPLRSSD